jgi:hypothetical protein
VVIARAYFDYDGGTWTARLSAEEDGGRKCIVESVAWTPMGEGQEPTGAAIVRKHLATVRPDDGTHERHTDVHPAVPVIHARTGINKVAWQGELPAS